MLSKKSYTFNRQWGECVAKLDNEEFNTFSYEEESELFYFQYIKRDISNELSFIEKNRYFDVITPFDYGAFYYTSDYILKKGLQEFEAYSKKENIISAFLRFNPVIEQDYELIAKYIKIIQIQEHIVIDLKKDYKGSFSKRKLRNIKNGQKYDYKFIVNDKIDNFYPLYMESMKRLEADKYFYFDKNILESLLNYCKIFSIYFDSKTVSSIFVIEEENNIYYFLGATLSAYLNYGFNSLLFSLVCEYYAKSKNIFFLGGGKEGLYQFKKEFSNRSIPFYIGQKIFDKEIYDKLIIQTDRQKNNFFPQYRKKTI